MRYEPVVGAALLGLEALCGEVSNASVALLEASLPEHLRQVRSTSLPEED